mgnify:CR=1 FL=1
MSSVESVVKVVDLRKWFPVRRGFLSTLFSRESLFVKAVDGVSFEIKKGEIFGLAGESGSGKTTTGRLILRLIEPTSGKIFFEGTDITGLSEKELKPLRRKMQIVFQDPYESLNPRMTIGDIVSEPLRVQKICKDEGEIEERVKEALANVELLPPEEFIYRFPHELSGGQRQRVSIARAFILNPRFVVADELVSMLDVSIRAGILNTILDLVEKFGVSFLYITHDLALARHICDRIAVMYLGKIMEEAPTEKIVYEPLHPYTKALISAVPIPDPESRRMEVVIPGEIPSPINPPSGCRFHTRCPSVMDICRKEEPQLIEMGENHKVACHLYQ